MKKWALWFVVGCLAVNGIQAEEDESTDYESMQNVTRFPLADGWELIACSDARGGTTPVSYLLGASAEAVQTIFPDGEWPSYVNTFIIRAPQENILVDTGFGRGRGHLPDNLKQLDITPDSIHAILLTHLHGDHVNGLLDDGQPAFQNATVFVNEDEKAYWFDEEILENLAPDKQGGFVAARAALTPYGERVNAFAVQGTTWQGAITPVAAYGHTPGHTGYLIQIDGQSPVFIWGDLMHCLPMQIKYPDVNLVYDQNPPEAAKTRTYFLKKAAAENWVVAGMHLPYPGVGRIKKADIGFEFIPGL